MFDNERHHESSHYDGLGGVRVHENGHFLYKSNQGDYHVRARLIDYMILCAFTGVVTGANPFLILPLIYASLSLPRKYSGV
jgi:hypothetical protein